MNNRQEVQRSYRARNKVRIRDQQRAYSAVRRMEMLALLSAIKLDAGCVDCGYDEWPEALDFDHLPGTSKRYSVSVMRLCSEETILAEIDKCEVRCANCHRRRTAERRLK